MKNIPGLLASPLAILPARAAAMLENYRARIFNAEPPARASVAISGSTFRSYDVLHGAAVIHVSGVLVHADPYWEETAYGDLAADIALAMSDEEVRGICLMINSPGGVVSGCFD